MFEDNTQGSVTGREAGGHYPQHVSRTAAEVAEAIRARLPGVPVTKLHKLLYYSQAHHLRTFGKPLYDESIMAWDMGPVVAQLWKAEQSEGRYASSSRLDESELNTVGYVVARYGALTGRDLEHLSHGESPWQRADEVRPPHGSVRIELDWIRDYFVTSDEDEAVAELDPSEVARWLADAETRLREPAKPDDLVELRKASRSTWRDAG